MENRVLVLGKNKQPLMACHPARARELLRRRKAAVYRREPFTIILKEREDGEVQPMQVKIDPGAETTGIAVVAEGKRGKRLVWAAEVAHRGAAVKLSLAARRAQPAKPQDTLPGGPLSQPTASRRVAAAVADEPNWKYRDLGDTAAALVSGEQPGAGVGEIR